MRDLRLLLEDRAHQPRQPRVDVDHLLELVEHERHLALALGAQLARQLEQPLERGVDVLRALGNRERERGAPVLASTVMVGLTFRSPKIRSRSRARSSGEAMSSWIARASFSASLAGVGVVMRSTLATSTLSRASSCAARHTSEDLP